MYEINNKYIELKEFLSRLNNKGLIESFNIISFIEVYLRLKDISLEYISLDKKNDIEEIFKNQKFFVYDFSLLDDKEFIIYFSFKKDLLYEFKNIFESYIAWNNDLTKEIWIKLWFPKCCINKFHSYFLNIDITSMKYYMYDYLRLVYFENTNNKNLDIFQNKRLIFHTPCSWNCKYSLKIAENSLKILKQDMNGYNYLIFPTNEYIRFKDNLYIWRWFYYEYNENWNREDFLKIMDYLNKNNWIIDFNLVKQKDILFIKFK